MKVIAFIEGRPKPQPRVTQKVKFLFGNSVQYWMKVDAENAKRAAAGALNKKGKPVRATRYAYRLQWLDEINAYRGKVRMTVEAATGGLIPYKNLFFFFLFHCAKTWSKKKKKAHEWQLHEIRPDYSNCVKGVEDALFNNDGKCNATSSYKLFVPESQPEGLLIMENEEIHRFAIDSAIEFLKKAP